MSVVSAQRLAEVAKLRCSIFGTVWNPTCVRTGSKYLKAPLKGPGMAEYYKVMKKFDFGKFNRQFGMNLVNLDEEQRLADVEARRRRGKGPPKKGEGKKASIRKKK